MTKPTECKWCGCGSVHSTSGSHVKFTCRSAWMADGDCWACSSQCCDGMKDRIQPGDRGLASRLLPDLAMILTGCRVGKNKSMPWLNVCRELGLTLKDLTDEAKRQGGTDERTK